MAKKTLNVEMAPELWALMGIRVGSAAGSVMVKGTKEARNPDPDKVETSVTDVNRRGLQATNSTPSEASPLDMFKGEEISDHGYVDISKVQMFFFTIAAWLGYVMVLWSKTMAINPVDGAQIFPVFSTSLVALVGISHAGYLTVKSAPKTPSK